MLPALLEESAANPLRPRLRDRRWLGVIGVCATVGLAACGGGERQDANEPEADFPVEIVSAEFPAQQSLAKSSELRLTVRNAGDEIIPDLAVTVFTARDEQTSLTADEAAASDEPSGGATGAEGERIPEGDLDAAVDQALEEELAEEAGDEGEEGGGGEENPASDEPVPEADGAFSVLSEQEGLAIPSRPVWILEAGYPRLSTDPEAVPIPGESSGGTGASSASSNTFPFGPLEPGETQTMIWQVTPVQAGSFNVFYRVAAGLGGKAVAVNEDGSVPEGRFVVVIDDEPPQTRVTANGKVVVIDPGQGKAAVVDPGEGEAVVIERDQGSDTP